MDRQTIALGVGGVFLIIVGAVFFFSRPGPDAYTPASIVVWGTAPKEYFTETIVRYQKTHEGSQISYIQKPEADFAVTLVNALAAGKGPDAWIADQEVMATHADKIRPFPSAFISSSGVKSSMVDLAYKLNAVQTPNLPTSQIRAVPLWVDPLVLFWNRDLFNSASIATPPSTWSEFEQTSTRLVRRDSQSNISVSGAAFGRGGNVPNAYDIVMLMLMQRGGNMLTDRGRIEFGNPSDEVSVGTSLTEDVTRYYTDFGNIGRSTYSWSASFSSPLDRFSGGKAGMMIDYLSRISDINESNPHLGVNISPVPQATNQAFTLARVSSFAVAAQSVNPTQAWHFGAYLAGEGASLITIPRGTSPALRSLLEAKTDAEYKQLIISSALQADWPRDPFPTISRSILSTALDAVANTKLTVSEGVSSMRAQLGRAINDFN